MLMIGIKLLAELVVVSSSLAKILKMLIGPCSDNSINYSSINMLVITKIPNEFVCAQTGWTVWNYYISTTGLFFFSLQDVIGCTQEMDFILWPRNDIEKIVCLLFSRWKGADDEPFRPVQVWWVCFQGSAQIKSEEASNTSNAFLCCLMMFVSEF